MLRESEMMRMKGEMMRERESEEGNERERG